METIIKILKSRTVWTLIFTFAINATQYLEPFYSPEVMVLVNAVLGAFAVYYKTNPSQDY